MLCANLLRIQYLIGKLGKKFVKDTAYSVSFADVATFIIAPEGSELILISCLTLKSNNRNVRKTVFTSPVRNLQEVLIEISNDPETFSFHHISPSTT